MTASRRIRRLLLPFSALLLFSAPNPLAPAPDSPPPVESLAAGGADLRTAFNADSEKVRLLVILSPT